MVKKDSNTKNEKSSSTGNNKIDFIIDHTKKKSVRNDESKKEKGGTPTTSSTGPGKTSDSNE